MENRIYRAVLVATIWLASCPASFAWVVQPTLAFSSAARTALTRSRTTPPPPTTSTSTTTALAMVECFNLEATDLSGDHEQVGSELAASLQRMLDEEWMPQEVHALMGQDVKDAYITCRENGQSDVMSIMTTAADKLTENWERYDAEAFVNAWDCANYVSDWLTTRSGEEVCECTQKLY